MMVTSSIRKLCFAGIASLLIVSGLATSTLSAQADEGPITLLQSPALGSLSSLGGISGYVNSQSGGDTNAWLTSQGVDPAASGPITNTTLPNQASGAITVSNNTVSLASSATGVRVGYLAGDAVGTDSVSTSLSSIAVAPGHENDSYALTQDEFLTWLDGTTWTGRFSMSGVSTFNVTIAWSLTGAKVTPSTSTLVNLAVASQFQTSINNAIATPGSLKLTDVVAGSQSEYSWSHSSSVPYSFAYSVGQSLVPGGSVSVNLNDTVADSWLNDLNIDNAQTSGGLADIPATSLIPSDALTRLSQLDGFSDFQGATTTADMTSVIMNDLMGQGVFDTWASDAAISQVQSVLTGITNGAVGFTMQSLSTASQTKMRSNTPAVMSLLAQDGFSDMFAHGVSATVQMNSTVNPGTITSLTPTGVTYSDPIDVDAGASTLTLSDSTMTVDPGICGGSPSVDPPSVTATATVVDTTGAPVVGAAVRFAVESPLDLNNSLAITNEDGIATTTITGPDPSSALDTQATTQVSAHVDFGSGADLWVPLTIEPQTVATTGDLPALTVEPTDASPVLADGVDSYTASITFEDACGVPEPGKVTYFSVTGSAQLSDDSVTSDENGNVSVTLTDGLSESVVVSATDEDGAEIAGPPVTVTFSDMPCTDPDQCTAPFTPPCTDPDQCEPCDDATCVATATPAGGTLSLDPTELASGGDAVATATVVDANGAPVEGVSVNFRIGGNASFAGGVTTAAPTDAQGQTVMLITSSTTGCDPQTFDVYASVTADDQVIQLMGSPAHASVYSSDLACQSGSVAPQVTLANKVTIAGSATPHTTVQVVTAAGAVLGTSPVDATGYWFMTTPSETSSQQIIAQAIDAQGASVASTTAWLDTDPPAPARIDRANTQEVAGNIGAVESSATITVVFPDSATIFAMANADGSYSVVTPVGMAQGVVTVTVTDTAGNPSTPATADLTTYVPPASTVTVSVKSAQAEVGGKQTVTGTGFHYLERVTVQLCSSTCTTVATGYAGWNGAVSITFTVPDVALGNYTVTLTGATSGTGTTSFQVVAPTAPPVTQVCAYLLWWAKWWWLFA